MRDGKVVGRHVLTGFVPRLVHDLESKGIAVEATGAFKVLATYEVVVQFSEWH